MIDAGLSEKKLSARMAQIDRSFTGIDAVFATHEHSDHIRGIGPLLRKYEVPFYTTEGTWRRSQHTIGKIDTYNIIRCYKCLQFTLHYIRRKIFFSRII